MEEAFRDFMPGEPPPPGVPWIWTGRTHNSYGVFGADGRYYRAHRASYEIFVEPIPKNLHVLHRLDIKLDVNPHNLYIGTHQDNMRDRDERGLLARGSRQGKARLDENAVEVICRIAGDIWTIHDENKETRKQYKDIRAFLAEKYDIHPKSIDNVLKGFAWKHLDCVKRIVQPVYRRGRYATTLDLK